MGQGIFQTFLGYGYTCGVKVMVSEVTPCGIDFFSARKCSVNMGTFYLLLAAENNPFISLWFGDDNNDSCFSDKTVGQM